MGCRCGRDRPTARVVHQRNHWTELHRYPASLVAAGKVWDPLNARRWYRHWLSRIPRAGCDCRHRWARLSKPPWEEGPHAFFEWAWERHNHISTKHVEPANPTISLAEAYALHWPQEYAPRSADVTIVSSINPAPDRQADQLRAVASWRSIGAAIILCNTPAEQSKLCGTFSADRWITDLQCSPNTAPLVRDLASVAQRIDRPILLVNSDIEIRGRQSALRRFFDGDRQTIGIRWNYETDVVAAREFEWGFDAFTFTPQQSRKLPLDMPLRIGAPVWDYAVPWFIRPSRIDHQRLFFHRLHPLRWNRQQWIDGSRWMAGHGATEFTDEQQAGVWRQQLEPHQHYHPRRGCYLAIQARHNAS